MRSVIVAAVTTIWLLMGCRGMETRNHRARSGPPTPAGPSHGPLMPTPDPSFSPGPPMHGPTFPGTSYHAPQIRSNGAIPVHGSVSGAPVITPTISLPRTAAPRNRWTAPTGSLSAPGEPALFPPGIYREMPAAP